MSNEDFDSTLTRLTYPFGSGSESNGLKIFHTAHGRYETGAPARVLAPFEIEGEKHVFAGFSCTPLVDFPSKGRGDADRIDGRTAAELGPGNQVLDMIASRRTAKATSCRPTACTHSGCCRWTRSPEPKSSIAHALAPSDLSRLT